MFTDDGSKTPIIILNENMIKINNLIVEKFSLVEAKYTLLAYDMNRNMGFGNYTLSAKTINSLLDKMNLMGVR